MHYYQQCIKFAELTSITGHMVKIMGWHDNEVGYSSRVVELIEKIGR